MGRRAATHTGVCRACGARRTINPVADVIRLHEAPIVGYVHTDCAGSLMPEVAGSRKPRDVAPPRPPSKAGALTLAERRCREFVCGYCSAPAGSGCVTLVHQQPTGMHVSRHRQAVAAGRLPLTDADLDADRAERAGS